MAGADTGTIVAVKIFVKRDEIAPVIIALELFRAAEDRPAAAVVAQKNACQTLRNLTGNLPEIRQLTRARGTFDFIIVAQKEVKLLQRLDKQVIDRQPNRSTPIGIAAEQSRTRFRRFVVDSIFRAVDRHFIRMIRMITGQSANAEWRQKLLFIEHIAQHAFQPVAINQRKKTARSIVSGFGLDVFAQSGSVFDKLLHAAFEAREFFDDVRVESLHGEKWNEPDHGTNLEPYAFAIVVVQHVIVKTVGAIP